MNWELLIHKIRDEQEMLKNQLIRDPSADIQYVRGMFASYENIIVLIDEVVKTEDDD